MEFAAELLEQNIEELGFNDAYMANIQEEINVADISDDDYDQFWLNDETYATRPDDSNYDFQIPASFAEGEPHNNFTMGGEPRLTHGGAVTMASGYEGKGKASGSGGSSRVYEIYSQRVGKNNSESTIVIQWRHVN
jgi:hypothetical protein